MESTLNRDQLQNSWRVWLDNLLKSHLTAPIETLHQRCWAADSVQVSCRSVSVEYPAATAWWAKCRNEVDVPLSSRKKRRTNYTKHNNKSTNNGNSKTENSTTITTITITASLCLARASGIQVYCSFAPFEQLDAPATIMFPNIAVACTTRQDWGARNEERT